MSVVTSARPSVSEGIQIMSRDLCNLHICILAPKNILEGYSFVEFVSELQFTTWRNKVEGILSELLFPLYLT
jgi:hypothetical protein